MGNSASSSEPLSVRAILQAIEDRPAATASGGGVDAAKVVLTQHGIVYDNSTTDDMIQECAALLESPGFWSQHSTVHPNQGRVKNWLWVHEKYRDQVQALVDMIPIESSEAAGIVPKVTAAFQKLQGKIKSHSAFEDEQLFSFFEQHVPATAASMKELKEDHATTTDSSAIGKALEEGQDAATIRAALVTYQNRLLEHLAREEDAVLPVWLGLSEEQYQALRSGMSWKYRVMYG